MSLTIRSLANCLGTPASTVLATVPFKNWTFEKSFEDDLEEPLIDFVFNQNGVDLMCNGDEEVITIFLYCDEARCFQEGLDDLPFSFTRPDVLNCLGTPARSGGMLTDPILGDFGPWDRFDCESYSVHVEYRTDTHRIKKITLMRADAVPE